MPEEHSPAVLSPPEPVVENDVSPIGSAPEIPAGILGRLHEITITRFEVNRRAATDKCTQRLLKKLEEAKAEQVPSRLEIDAQRKAVAIAQQRYNHLLSRHERKKANIQMAEARLHHRLTRIQESLEAAKIRRIRGKMRPMFRVALERAESMPS